MKKPFGMGPTTPGLGDLLIMVAIYLLNGMILQVLFLPCLDAFERCFYKGVSTIGYRVVKGGVQGEGVP